jgi:hypothetical protein
MIQHAQKFKLPAVFIVSSGRSGTTLLSSMLNASEEIYIPYESDFIARAYPYYHQKKKLDRQDYKTITKLFQATAQEDGWGMSEDYLFSYLIERSPQTFAEVNSVICEAFHKQESTEELLWGIKAPVLIASLERIKQVCPTAKIVHLIRDGRDVYLSYKKVHKTSEIKFGPKGVIENALYWVDGLKRVEDFLKINGDSQIYELRYSDLVSNPQLELKKLCDYLGIEYKALMHENFNDLERNQKIAPKYLRKTIHQKLQNGLDSKNTNKYKEQMTTREKVVFELIAIPYLIKYAYNPDYIFLNTFLLQPIRTILYFMARQFNNWRYAKRDEDFYQSVNTISV